MPLLPPTIASLKAYLLVTGIRSGLLLPGKEGGVHSRGYDWGWADTKYKKGGKVVVRPGLKSRAGITRRLTLYAATRHTCATHMLVGTYAKLGHMTRAARLEEVQKWLGHSSRVVTERYAKYTTGALHELVAVGDAEDFGANSGPTGPEDQEAMALLTAGSDCTNAEPPPRIELGTYGLRNLHADE